MSGLPQYLHRANNPDPARYIRVALCGRLYVAGKAESREGLCPECERIYADAANVVSDRFAALPRHARRQLERG